MCVGGGTRLLRDVMVHFCKPRLWAAGEMKLFRRSDGACVFSRCVHRDGGEGGSVVYSRFRSAFCQTGVCV